MRTVLVFTVLALAACNPDDSASSPDAGADVGADAAGGDTGACTREIPVCYCGGGECYDADCNACTCVPGSDGFNEAGNDIDEQWCVREVPLACDFDEDPTFIPGSIYGEEALECYRREHGEYWPGA